MATEELWPTLLRFHREIIVPENRRSLEEAITASERRLRDEMHSLNDGLVHRLENLTEHHVLVAGLRRVEDRLAGLEGRVAGLDDRVAGLDGRLANVEVELAALREERAQILGRMAAVEQAVRDLDARRA